ncbi:cytochrome P450 2C28 [Nephila pilipes]|uniref:Cytochrome P450 2C28 n=1 Tax=Nephila pilipes TaxID=299642 RepID=A0A8X6PV48_NEPPI|nr:cytochrome P450 2C28 [Nephila pilipes]
MDAIAYTFTALILLVLIRLLVKSPRQSFIGPIGLPNLGYNPFMTEKPYIKITELSQTYGSIYSIPQGSIDVVVITDNDITKEAFSKNSFMGRPPDLPFEFSKEIIRTGAINGMPWKEQRRFFLHMLRDLGFGKTKMEEHIKDEILEFLQRMPEIVGKPTQLSYILAPSISNNIASLLFGNRLKYSDPEQKRLDVLIQETGRLAGVVSWHVFFPCNRIIISYLNIGDKGNLVLVLSELQDYCRKEIRKHEETLDLNNIRDFIDSYVLGIQKPSNNPNTAFTSKRSCPGESLAKVETFLYLVAILHKFEVFAPSEKEVDLEGMLGTSLQPRNKICVCS